MDATKSLEKEIQDAKRSIEISLENAIGRYFKSAIEHPEHFDGLSSSDIKEQLLEMLWDNF